MENKKEKNPIKKLARWWDGLSFNTQVWITCGLWFADGLLWGSAISDIKNTKKANKAAIGAACSGYMMGQADAYKEMAMQNSTVKKV